MTLPLRNLQAVVDDRVDRKIITMGRDSTATKIVEKKGMIQLGFQNHTRVD